ncbi:LacI family DNA-binding transcriptional regulator [Paenibacillus chondroitinus]|uniref:LacI family DNA-binding transcriptional regulator n=1 Tax=Paenibacillus chondroitinus TaxID=59842 RepID=A0ABU6DEB7_9BACL|nr:MULTISPECIES: LacI family DNA-binding transcriptional regulator [Paenibacillus]MCY9658695.1 LacI family transcriptional regulator [Paenibacillus anseongense]MEB4796080.1 LacI family DNA-binding transcriptional regulator [Paenibacillus chondroitinus]
MKATIYDVAREAGVSIAAVSQVINGKGKISEERRNEIFLVMERLNYRPSVIAAALTGKKTYTLGLLVPDISNPFFAEIAHAVEDQGHKLGYSIVICSTHNEDERIERYLTLLQQKSVDGMIIGTGMDNLELLSPLVDKSIPIVSIAREMASPYVQTVHVGDFEGGKLAAQHLLELGHTRIAVLAEHLKVSSSRERIRGFREALAGAGLELPEASVKSGGYDLLRDGKRQTMELLQQEGRPSALFCCNDLLAIGALQAAKALGLRVPEDVSIVGFDDTILASVTDPPLTTIAQPIEAMGKLAVDLVIAQLANKADAKPEQVLKPELVVRKSTGAISK